METNQTAVFELFFPGYDPETTRILNKILNICLDISHYTFMFELPLSIVAIILNIAHFVVLTRKSMMINSINLILAVLAVNDIFMMLVILLQKVFVEWKLARSNIDCVPFDLLSDNIIRLTSRTLQMMCRRNSSWLAIIMATIRTLCITYSNSDVFSILSTMKSAMYAAGLELMISFCISSIIPIPYLIYKPLWLPEEDLKWSQKKLCPGYPILPNKTEHTINYSNDDLQRTTYIDALTINVIPSLIYPVMTFFLTRAIREANSRRKRVKRKHERDRSTVIVLTMTISFMIAEIPQAISYFIKIFDSEKFGFGVIGELSMQSFANLSLLNSCTHGLICFGLSTNYRSAVYTLLRLKKETKPSGSRLAQLQSIPAVSSATITNS